MKQFNQNFSKKAWQLEAYLVNKRLHDTLESLLRDEATLVIQEALMETV